jgi:hypothetical protein
LKARRDPETHSALMISLSRHQGVDAALGYVQAEGISASDLTPLGAMILIARQAESGEFQSAFAEIKSVPVTYFDECPLLYRMRAQLIVASLLPSDQKVFVFQDLPLDPKMLQLPAGPASQQAIKAACRDLQTLLGMLPNLKLEILGPSLSEFDLWLRLEADDTREAAHAQLAAEIGDPEKTLQRVRLALAFGIPFNHDALQRRLDATKEVGGWTTEERFAAFLLVCHDENRTNMAEFFARNHEDLFAQEDLALGTLAALEIDTLARLGRFDDARSHLQLHYGRGDLAAEQFRALTARKAHRGHLAMG